MGSRRFSRRNIAPNNTLNYLRASREPSRLGALYEAAQAAEEADDFAAAESLLRQLVREAPEFGDVHANLGRFYYNLGKLGKAKAHTLIAIQRCEAGSLWSTCANNNLGLIDLAAGRYSADA